MSKIDPGKLMYGASLGTAPVRTVVVTGDNVGLMGQSVVKDLRVTTCMH